MIALEDCIKGHVYEIKSRNLKFGVFNGHTGFIGIKNKLKIGYKSQGADLATEYHIDAEGTVRPYKDLGELDKNIQLKERFPSMCHWCGYLVTRVNGEDVHVGEDIVGPSNCNDVYAFVGVNKALFFALEEFEEKKGSK